MQEVTRLRLRTLIWFLLVPLTLGGVVPWWLAQRFEGPWVWTGSLRQWLGIWLILNGLGLAGWCVQLFNVQGRGTPLPLDPPRRLVAQGPYRVVRNPMMLGMFLVLCGEAGLYQSRAVALYALAVTAAGVLFVRCWEEPGLERRFGAPYAAYRRAVPRWFPRWPRSGV